MQSCEAWYTAIVTRMYQLVHAFEPDNFDAERYADVSPATYFYELHAAYFVFFTKRADAFFAARNLLADDESRSLFDQLILYKALGHQHVRLPFNTPESRGYRNVTAQWEIGNAADGLTRFAVPAEGGSIRMECWHGNVAANVIWRQYWFERDGHLIMPTTGDHAIDAGACFGDTTLCFASSVGDSGHVYAFDPIPKHCAIARRNVSANPMLAERIRLFPFGLSDSNGTGDGRVRVDRIDPGARLEGDLPTRTIDDLDLPRVDFIKMDIEGSELAALKGGEQSLRRWKPKLAISLYHRPEDFFAIPLWLDSLGLGYRFFLDHYSIHQEESVLYAKAS